MNSGDLFQPLSFYDSMILDVYAPKIKLMDSLTSVVS